MIDSYKMWERELKSVLFRHVSDVPADFDTAHDWYEDYAEGITPSESVERFLNVKRDEAQ
jgi:hypothetical protein